MHLEAGKRPKSQRLACGVCVLTIIGAKALNIIFADDFRVIFFGRSFTSLLPIT